MNLKAIFKKDYIVGLDIGSSSVKLAEFAQREDGLHLVRADLKEIRQTEDKAHREKEILSALKDLFSGIDVKKSKIILNINCPITTMKKVVVPHMPKGELEEGLRLEAKNYFPFPIDDTTLDFEILGDVVEKGVRKYEVALAVSPKKTVDMYLALLEKSGIKPDSFIPCPYSLQKIAEHSVGASAGGGSASGGKGKTTCFVDIGELHTELVIFKGTTLMFCRKIPVTGQDFTKTMTGVLVSDRGKTELSIDEAEKIKREVGIPSEGEAKIIDDKISTTQILSMIRSPLEQLVNEIDRCFDYYREETGGGKIDSVVLFGGGASLAGLIKFLSEGLGVEVRLGDSLEGLEAEPDAVKEKDKTSYRLELAIGAALSEGKGINLLPPEIKEEAKRVVKRGTITGLITAIVLVSVLLYVGMKIKLDNFEKRISVAKLEFSGLQPQFKKAEAHHLANMILVEEPHWEDVFKELSNVIPEDVYLTEVSMQKGVITIKGIVALEDGEQLISNLILTLEQGMFESVKLLKSKDLKGKTGNEFELRCRAE